MLTNLHDTFSGKSRPSNIGPIPFYMLDIISYYAIVTLSLRRAVFRYSTSKDVVTLKSGSKITRGHRNRHVTVTISHLGQFLLTFHSKHGATSHRFRDRRGFQTKIAKFSHPRVFYSPADEVPLGIGYLCEASENWNDRAISDGRKSFKIGLAI